VTNTKFVVVGVILLISCGYAYGYTTSLLPQVQQGSALCQTWMGIAGQLYSPEVSGKCQQVPITLAVPITAILAILGFMLGVYGAWINPKPKVAQTDR
jgi:uncharacterized membrane protein SpoIIM required for sporulation